MVGENRQEKSPGEHEAGRPADGATAILRLDLLRTYRLSWLPGDLLAGVVIFAVTIPTALAYGQLAGLQAVNGLYASLLAMAIYAFFGTSRQLIIDAEAAIAILVASSVAAVAGVGDPARFAALAMMEAVMVGGLLAVGGIFRLGFLADFIPKTVVLGFINGVALIVIMAQLGKITGIELTQHDFFPRAWEFYTKMHQTNQLTLAIGGACLLGLVIFSLVPLVPEAVVVLVLATVAVQWWFPGGSGVSLVGLIPAGLPKLELPPVGFADIVALLPVAIGVTLVAYMDTTITGRYFANKGGYRLDHNQEMIALGLTNIGTGLFQGFTVGASHSRTTVNDMYGGRSQLAGLIAAGSPGAVFTPLHPHPAKCPAGGPGGHYHDGGHQTFQSQGSYQNLAHAAGVRLFQCGYYRRSAERRSHDRDIGGSGFRHYPGAAPSGPAS